MKAKYKGDCCYCNASITVGVDTYDISEKRSYHEACREKANGQARESSEQLAERLHFIDARELDGEHFKTPDAWLLPVLQRTVPGDSTGRIEPGSLFDQRPA